MPCWGSHHMQETAALFHRSNNSWGIPVNMSTAPPVLGNPWEGIGKWKLRFTPSGTCPEPWYCYLPDSYSKCSIEQVRQASTWLIAFEKPRARGRWTNWCGLTNFVVENCSQFLVWYEELKCLWSVLWHISFDWTNPFTHRATADDVSGLQSEK